MELDELKQTWKQAEATMKPANANIIELMQNKSYGPVAELKRRFRKQLIIIPFLVAIVINNLSIKHNIFSDPIFWCYIAFCTFVCASFYFNYRLLNKMQCMDCMIKSNLEVQVKTLETRLQWHVKGVRIMLVFMIVLLEVLMYLNLEPSFHKWQLQPISIRFASYLALVVLQYFVSKLLFKRKYGNHLQYVKKLVAELQ
jgi:hypothetical protein